jgi:transposase InsO family protein
MTACARLSQAFMKRGLPRALMTDNGAAMLADETVTGLAALGVVHQTTLPYSPYQYVALKNMWPPASLPRRREAGSRVNAT